jgi:TolB-like protein
MSETLGHYKILDRIGAGVVGEVYRARDTSLGRTVAITEVAAAITDDPERRERFSRDARASLVLSHPNIAALYEVDDDQGQLYLVREFIPGQTLALDIAGHAMNPRRALELAIQLADALADAHAAGIVHRDLRPDNIIVTPKGNAKILNFGLGAWTGRAATRDEAETTAASASAAAACAYISPEQALGERFDHRTDIFSFGVVLFEMLTGRLPFDAPTAAELTRQIVRSPAPPVTSVGRAVPAVVDPIVAKMLAKSLDQRYGSAAPLAADLRAAAAALDARSTASEPANVAAGRPSRRSPNGRIVIIALIAVITAVFWWQRAAIGRLSRHAMDSAAPLIAVVPFDAQPEQTFFADGFGDDLMARLGQTPGLKVLGRSGTRDNRGRPARDVARELHAAVVLSGSIRRTGNGVTLNVALTDPRDDSALWTGQYTRDTANIFAVQAQVAEDIARALRVTLAPTASSERARSRAVDPRAYDAYLHGRQAAADHRLGDARRFYDEAIRVDDGLAEAYGGLAEALALEPRTGGSDDPSRRARLKRAAERAYELAPDSPQANVAMALTTDHLPDALAYLKKSIAIDASYSDGYRYIGDEIADFDPDRAVAFYRRALALDPRMTASQAGVVTTLAAAGRSADAAGALAAASDPHGTWIQAPRIQVALQEHQFTAALSLFGDWRTGDPGLGAQYANVLRSAGRGAEARTVATELVRLDRTNCEAKATLAGLTAERGQTAAARQLVAEAIASGRLEDIGPVALRCAIQSVAAIGDAGAAAAFLRRIAADERLQREWTLNMMGTTGSARLRAALYPWNRVADQPAVVEARRVLDRALAAARQQSGEALGDITPAAAPPLPRS